MTSELARPARPRGVNQAVNNNANDAVDQDRVDTITEEDDDDDDKHGVDTNPCPPQQQQQQQQQRRQEEVNKLNKLFSLKSIKRSITAKKKQPWYVQDGDDDDDDDDDEENDPLNLGNGLRAVQFPEAERKDLWPNFANVEGEFNSMYNELEKQKRKKELAKKKAIEQAIEQDSLVVSALMNESEERKGDIEETIKVVSEQRKNLRIHNRFFRITLYSSFDKVITYAVVLYALLETADNWEGNGAIEKKGGKSWDVIQAFHYIVSLIFVLEAAIKIAGAGRTYVDPLTGKEILVEWNPLAYFKNWENAIDFSILFFMILNYIATWGNFTLGYLTYEHIRIIRLFRLNRGIRYFRRNPEFKIILDGIGAGIQAMGWVLVMLMTVMYIYAVMGTNLFYGLDPKNFRSLAYSFNSGMGIATGSSWDEFIYSTWYGCEKYGYAPPGNGEMECPYRLKEDGTKEYMQGNGVISAVYVISMSFLVGNIMMSLFIGIITEKMDNAYAEKEEVKRIRIEKALARTTGAIFKSQQSLNEMLPEEQYTEVMSFMNLFSGLKQSKSMREREEAVNNTWLQNFQAKLQKIFQNDYFEGVIISVIALSAILSGYATTFLDYSNPNAAPDEWVEVVERIFIGIFMIEFLLKIVALWDKERTYYTGEDRNWNVFDAGTTLLGFFGMVLNDAGVGGGELANFTRIVRLFRLSRLFRFFRVIPQLNLIAKSLVLGVKSLKYVGTLMCFIFYTWAIAGVMLFSENDPFFMRTLPVAFYHLFRLSQLESWANIVQINLEGCDKNRWGVNDGGSAYVSMQSNSGIHPDSIYECTQPHAQPFIGAIYFYTFLLLCGMVIISVFIGVIVSGMHEATAESKIEFEREKRKNLISEHFDLSAEKKETIRRVWKRINWRKAKTIQLHQIEKLMQQIGIEYIPGYLHKVVSYWKPPPDTAAEESKEGKINEIDYPDFILLACLLERADK